MGQQGISVFNGKTKIQFRIMLLNSDTKYTNLFNCKGLWKRHMSKRPIGRPKTRWEDDVFEDIKSINISNWKKAAQNRDSWQERG